MQSLVKANQSSGRKRAGCWEDTQLSDHPPRCSELLWLQGDTIAKRNAWKAASPALERGLHGTSVTGIKKLNSCTGIPATSRILGESTANPAGCQRCSRLSPWIPFNPGSIPLRKGTWRAAVPSPWRPSSCLEPRPGARAAHSMCPQAGAASRHDAARCRDFTSGNILPSLCQRVTACALILYFYRGGNLGENMYSELLNSTSATEAHLILQTNTPYLGSTQRPVSSSAFYMSTARVLKEGEINKPDLIPPGSEEPVEDTGCLTRGGTASSSSSRKQQPCAPRRFCPHGSERLRPSLKS
ncbi:uncharacterized protein LOC110405262 isoform X2 [Numida meleagris]|uniref:uncharacterized protein LOC110405262 isoform X2 n=1 Tax=Numida meleagris TaxID=8996 RepID=UPI000B3E23A7|nr:uncharacterized protein LOC110405262 isoform X2 [Numida meleagris]